MVAFRGSFFRSQIAGFHSNIFPLISTIITECGRVELNAALERLPLPADQER
jgi:hypothetical protein